MDEFLRFWSDLSGRVVGPMTFRLYVQPATAIFFAILAGMRDAKAGHTPYLWALLLGTRGRHELIVEAWRDVGRVFVAGVVIDTIYQAVQLRWFYPVEALAVATLLALLPYLLVRGPVTRLMRRLSPYRG
jgi:hypothetical protein